MTNDEKLTKDTHYSDRGCYNCEHHYMNHKPCDLPDYLSCVQGTQWMQRKNSESFDEQKGETK